MCGESQQHAMRFLTNLELVTGPEAFGDKNKLINELLTALRARFGEDALIPYGEVSWDHAVGFRIRGVDATFSVLTEHSPEGVFDIQIEGIPLGEYVYCDDATVDQLVELAVIFSGPRKQWPNWTDD